MCQPVFFIGRKVKATLSPLIPIFLRDRVNEFELRMDIMKASGSLSKAEIVKEALMRGLFSGRTVLFYPEKPRPFHVLYKVVLFLGYRVTVDPKSKWDIAIKWFNAYDGNPLLPEKGEVLQSLGNPPGSLPIFNLEARSISKNYIGDIFQEIFQYPVAVDPTKITGECVAKSDWNALHEGKVIQCPIKNREVNVSYQVLIDNKVDGERVVDIRVPMFRGKIPFVYLKYRSLKDRFVDRKHTDAGSTIAEVGDVFSKEEVGNLGKFCERLGLDYCEMDVLRDRKNGKIYIVDVNNTPSGPIRSLSPMKAKNAIFRLARTFEKEFLDFSRL